MKFAQIQYAANTEEIHINGFMKRMPRKMKEFYIEKRNPYTLEEMKLLNTEGYQVCLPITREQASKDSRKNDIIVRNTLKELSDREVGIVIPPKEMAFPNVIRNAEGKIIFSFLLMKTINRVFRLLERERKNAEFLLIDGSNFITDLVLDIIHPNVNFLAIYTDRSSRFEEKAEEIYQSCGLNVQVFSNSKNAFLREADVIINCGMDLENYDYFFKKRAVYLDANQNKAKLKRLMVKRQDMLFIDGIKLKKENDKLEAELYESIEYINNQSFRQFLTREYHPAAAEMLNKYFDEQGLSIFELMCNGKKVGENCLLSMKNNN